MAYGTDTMRHILVSGSAFALALSLSGAAWAQAGAAPTTAGSEPTSPVAVPDAVLANATEDIVVTGSRLATGFAAPSPVSVVGTARLDQRGAANIADALNEVPAFRATNTPSSGELSPAAGYIGGRILDLRGLGAVRTLTLVDGKRFVPSTTQATVDTNMIPSILLERAEVVTGGASAQYGSDAVAGVVNLILNDKLNGIKATAQQQITKYGDGSETTLGLAWGGNLNDRLHLTIGGEWQQNRGIGDCQARPFCRTEVLNFGRNPGYNVISANNILANERPSTVPFNGVTVPAASAYAGRATPLLRPIDGITFNPNGTPRRFQYGSLVNNLYQIGGEGAGENIYFKDLYFTAPTERYAITGNLAWDVTPDITASLMLNYGHLTGEYSGTQFRNTALTIQRDNAFIPRSTDLSLDIPTLLAASGATSFQLGKGFAELGRLPLVTKNDTYRAVFSLEGKLGSAWAWDAYYQYGRNDFSYRSTNNVVVSRLTRALDAVRNSAGQIVCRVNADASTANDDAACAPYNPFGYGQQSAAAQAYVTGSGLQTNKLQQHVVAANFRGPLFDLPAGALSVAFGGEYRSDSAKGAADALSQTLSFFAANAVAVSGKVEVTEGYVEAELPILKDMLFHELSLNGAARRTHYKRSSDQFASSTVNVTTWKAGAVFEPIEAIRFRTTRSRDIRAPNISELFGPVTQASGILNDPALGGLQTNLPIFGGSNPLLTPEKADTFTAGIVLKPVGGFLGRFRLSVDYYNIKIDNAISTLGQQNIATRCFQGDAFSCSLITRGPAAGNAPVGPIISLRDTFQNINQLTNRGVDTELSYRQPLGALGTANVRLLATYVKDLVTVDAVGPTQRAGQTGLRGGTPAGLPDWVIDGLVSWDYNAFTLNTHVRWINKGFYNAAFVGPDDPAYNINSVNSVNFNTVPSRTYVDLLGQYRIDRGSNQSFTFFAGVDNVFNTMPPLNPGSHGTGNNILFNASGTTFKGGVRMTY
jgi:iron complex outermembrane receptor protein